MKQNINNKALLLIEFQHEWLHEEGKLYPLMTDKKQFLASIECASKVITAVRSSAMPVIHSGLSFQPNYPELGHAKCGLRSAIPAHQTFLSASDGSQFVEPFVPMSNEFVVNGRVGGSAFAGSNLDAYLRNNNIKTIYLMGYALHVCVESTLRAAHDLGYEVFLIEDATAAFTDGQKQHVLNDVVHHFGERITANQFINTINQAGEVK